MTTVQQVLDDILKDKEKLGEEAMERLRGSDDVNRDILAVLDGLIARIRRLEIQSL